MSKGAKAEWYRGRDFLASIFFLGVSLIIIFPWAVQAQLTDSEILRIDVNPSLIYSGDTVSMDFYIRLEGFDEDLDDVKVEMYSDEDMTNLVKSDQADIPSGGAVSSPIVLSLSGDTVSFGPGEKYRPFYLKTCVKNWPYSEWKPVGKEIIYVRNATPPDTADAYRYEEYAEAAYMRYMALVKIKDELEEMSDDSLAQRIYPWNRLQDFTNGVVDRIDDIDAIAGGINSLSNLPSSTPGVAKAVLDARTAGQAISGFFDIDNIQESLQAVAGGSFANYLTWAHMDAQIRPVFCSSLFAGSDCTYTDHEGIIDLVMHEETEWFNIHAAAVGGDTVDFTQVEAILDQEKSLLRNNESIIESLIDAQRCPDFDPTYMGCLYYDQISAYDKERFLKFVNNGNQQDVQDTCLPGDPFDPCTGYINKTGHRFLEVISVDRVQGIKALISQEKNASGQCFNANKIGSDVRITNDADWSRNPSLAWSGSEFGVRWDDQRDGNTEIYFARISASGTKIGSDVRITNGRSGGWSWSPNIACTGTEYGVIWYDDLDGNWEIYFSRISATGEKIGPDVRITNAADRSSHPSLAWTGTEYGVSWRDSRDGNNEIYFARISASGEKIGSDVRITNAAGSSTYPSLAWSGSEYGVSWEDDRDGNNEIYFARISASGEKIGSDVRITNAAGSSHDPSLVWTGTGYGVSWSDYRDGNNEIYFARISASGNKIGSDVRITNDADHSRQPSLVWTGTEFGVSWRQGNYDIYFARISASGEKIGSDVRITNDGRNNSLAWTGTGYGVSWRHYQETNNDEIYFAIIGCCMDGDSDGYYPATFYCPTGDDCDDGDENVHPGAAEVCNNIDDNCDGNVDEGLSDFDYDGFSAPGACSGSQDDCDDTDYSIYPGAIEILCDAIDQNCNGMTDDDRNHDADSYSVCDGDCNDYDAAVHPGATEIVCDFFDQDCDGLADDDIDGDGDGLYCWDEFIYGTSDSDPDSDDDLMIDGYEVDNFLDPAVADSMTADYDNDGNPNVHEYFNGTLAGDIAHPDPYCGAGGFCFGDSGDLHNGIIDAGDITRVINYHSTSGDPGQIALDYRGIIPDNGDSADLNGNGIIDANDITVYQEVFSGTRVDDLPGAAVSMNRTFPPGLEVTGGSTIEVELMDSETYSNDGARTPRSGYGVVFWIDSTSTGSGRIYGGDGAPTMEDGFTSSLDARYDVTETMIDGGKARVYLHILSGGTIQVNARTPANALKHLPSVPASDKYKMPFTASP